MRMIKKFILPFWIVYIAGTACIAAQLSRPHISAPYAFAVKQGQRAVEALRNITQVPGFSVAVGVRDSIVWSEGFGYADLETRTPVTRRTKFRIASVSKVLTAAAVARLYQEGRLDLDTPIRTYVPSWPDKGHIITARQLAGHLGSIREYREEDFTIKNIDSTYYDTVSEALEIFAEDTLVAPPGTRYSYSTFGYTLLSAVLEAASGQEYLSYMEQEIFDPLEMRETVPNRPDSVLTELTTLYDRNQEGQVVTVPNMRPSYKWAGGGFVSTAEDLVRFGLAHLKSNFFEHETLAMMFTSQKTVDGKETGVGIGWMISRDPWGRRIVFHNGRQLGARSVLVVYPADNLAIAILSNLTGIPQLIEGVAVSIADPFIRIINGDACQFADEELIGNYQYLVGMPDNGSRGTLTISELMGRYSYQGSMTTSPNAKISQIPITSLVVYKSGISAIVAAPEGLLPIKLKTTPTGFSGFLTFHKGRNPQDISIEINRQ